MTLIPITHAAIRRTMRISILILCSVFATSAQAAVQLRFIGSKAYLAGTIFQGVPFGGLSGLAYDPQTKKLLAQSDDRGQRGPVRFYHLNLEVTAKSFSVEPQSFTQLRRKDGSSFPVGSIDPESITRLPDGSLLITSEPHPNVPAILLKFSSTGQEVSRTVLPEKFVTKTSLGNPISGMMFNGGFEAGTLHSDGNYYVAPETGMVQDDTYATGTKGSYTRILRYRNRNGALYPSEEYVYAIDKIPGNPDPALPQDNGLVEFFSTKGKLLAIERAYVRGTQNSIRIYEIDWTGATEVSSTPALRGRTFQPVGKRLVLDLKTVMNRLQPGFRRIDNIESATIGPKLANGNPTLILASDDNFNVADPTNGRQGQITQFIAFEIQGQ